MRRFAAVLVVLGAVLASNGYAQNWAVFVPAERDFRVLFPEQPSRTNESDRSVGFKAMNDDVQYAVYRLPPGTLRIADEEAEIRKRLGQRYGEDTRVRPVRDEDDSDEHWRRHVFEVRGGISVHRLVEHRGRYYELHVFGGRESRMVAKQTARDFFNSFYVEGISLPAIGGTVVRRIEEWCQNRTNAFARAFCEYSVCLHPGYEQYPHCAVLRGR